MRRFRNALFLLLLAGALPAHGAEKADALAKEIRVELWGRHLGEAVSQITERASVDVRVSPHLIRPKEFPQYVLYLQADALPVRVAVEWLARALGCRYRVDGPSSVWITGSYDWIQAKTPQLLIENVGGLMKREPEPRAFENLLWEVAKPCSLFDDFALRVEMPDRMLVATVPDPIKKRLRAVLQAMSKPGLPIREPAPQRLPPETTALLDALRKPVVVHYREQPLRAVLQDLSLQSGIAIGADQEAIRRDPGRKLTLDLGEVSLRQAVESLGQALQLGGVEMYPPAAVWLTAGQTGWAPAASREFLWEDIPVEAYAAGPLAERLGGGEVLAHHLRRTVSPETWNDPATAILYHQPSGNLIVVAPAEVQILVRQELYRLVSSPAGETP